MGGRGREAGCLGVGPRPHCSDISAGPAAAASATARAIGGLFLYFNKLLGKRNVRFFSFTGLPDHKASSSCMLATQMPWSCPNVQFSGFSLRPGHCPSSLGKWFSKYETAFKTSDAQASSKTREIRATWVQDPGRGAAKELQVMLMYSQV